MAKCDLEKVKLEINKLVANKKISEAIKAANEYLENYYWTMKESNVIKHYIEVLTSEQQIIDQNKWFLSLSKINQLKEIFKDPKTINYEWFSIYELSFKDQFPDEEINYFEYILKSKLYKNDVKLSILELLQENVDNISPNNDYLVKVYSSFLNKYINIDLRKWWISNDDLSGKFEYYHNVKQIINERFFKNPTFNNEAKEILKKVALTHLNLPTNYTIEQLSDQICNYVEAIYSNNLNQIKNNESFRFIISILNYFSK